MQFAGRCFLLRGICSGKVHIVDRYLKGGSFLGQGEIIWLAVTAISSIFSPEPQKQDISTQFRVSVLLHYPCFDMYIRRLCCPIQKFVLFDLITTHTALVVEALHKEIAMTRFARMIQLRVG